MAKRRAAIPHYGTTMMNGTEYYRTRIRDANGKRISIYGRTPTEVYEKVQETRRQLAEETYRRESPTVKEYCEKWLLMQSAHIRATTLIDYTSKVKIHIIEPLGHMRMADVTVDDIRLALVPLPRRLVRATSQ